MRAPRSNWDAAGGGPRPPLTPGDDPLYGSRQRSWNSVFPAWGEGIQDVFCRGSAAVPANSVVTLCSFVVGKGQVAYFNGLGQDAVCGAFAEVTWQVMIGDRIWVTYDTAQVGTFSFPRSLNVFATGGAKVAVRVSTGANGYTLAACLYGLSKGQDQTSPERG